MPESGLPIRVYEEHDMWHVDYGEGETEDHTSRTGSRPKLSISERRLYEQARQLLAREIGSARGLEQVEADAWIEDQVAPTS